MGVMEIDLLGKIQTQPENFQSSVYSQHTSSHITEISKGEMWISFFMYFLPFGSPWRYLEIKTKLMVVFHNGNCQT